MKVMWTIKIIIIMQEEVKIIHGNKIREISNKDKEEEFNNKLVINLICLRKAEKL